MEKLTGAGAGLIFDMDNDSYKDIYVTNGIPHDLTDIDFVDFFANEIVQKLVLTGEKEQISEIIDKMPVRPVSNFAYKNNMDLTFSNVSTEWGLNIPSFSNGCAYADLDNDGDLDIVVNNINTEAFIFRNNSESITQNNYLKIRLIGVGKNRFAIGTEVTAYVQNDILYQEQMPFRGFQSSVDYSLNFGLGDVKKVDSLIIKWPNDKISFLTNIEANQQISLNQDDASKFERGDIENNQISLLEIIENNEMISHVENYFNDFDFESLIQSKLSQEGPATAVGDVNGDGNDDVFFWRC